MSFSEKPHPLGLTAAAFARAYERVHGGAVGAYKGIFRDGRRDWPGAGFGIAPIVRVLREESPEGEVVKFVQELGGGRRRS